MKSIYLIRHCSASGQEPDAELTGEGSQQAERLAEFLSQENIERIISSPFTRAVQSIEPLRSQQGIELTLDMRLTERILSKQPLEDWLEKLEASFSNMDQVVGEGESSQIAQNRIVEVLEDLLRGPEQRVALVSHGNLLSLLLNYVDPRFGFREWQSLSNPDVYLITSDEDGSLTMTRLWKS
ncbi:histidine phosphatase family protein [Alkalicoccobacillus murimartini]|uniref:2,3-bisphosphoglycerate-dependent phosphoglycerate mutase n=1 Tax=Alkalicoccobacillus murimartini TaxID=171685 RepID=A0ABT9YMF2_9BACI|nr:histidine phosphatase family protein [Alkalicoccobacillus murimartini]MDQ0208377.1 2,3-bisphosphoglycerate-dependent phosphoglycerate mutase [Alkalicoccobacillus murimartini]